MDVHKSQHSLIEASKGKGRFSDDERGVGVAGITTEMTDLAKEAIIIRAPEGGFGRIKLELSWDKVDIKKPTGWKAIKEKFTGSPATGKVDLDLGCLYELKDGSKGCLQAFGDMYGAYDTTPFIEHSGDERTGETAGIDECLMINGNHWADIKRILVYAYIYEGVVNWEVIRSHAYLHACERTIHLDLAEQCNNSPICALMALENKNDTLAVTRRVEYFPGHLEMDRAYGFGLKWEEGSKS